MNDAAHLFACLEQDGRWIELPSLASALEAHQSGRVIWLDFIRPAEELLQPLVPGLGIHPLSIEDCFDEDQVPKIEDFPKHTFILFNRLACDAEELHVGEVDFMLGERFLVSVNFRNGIETGRRPQSNETMLEDYAQGANSPDSVLYELLDKVVQEKLPPIEAIEERLDEAEGLILEDSVAFNPLRLSTLRRNLLMLRKSLFHEREILIKMSRRDTRFITEKNLYHFRDIYDHLAKLFELSELHREMVSNLMDMYLSMINNRMTIAAGRTNSAMRRLTLITTIFMPLTLISGVFGMSEWSMIMGPENWRLAYPLFFALMAVIASLTYLLLKAVERREDR